MSSGKSVRLVSIQVGLPVTYPALTPKGKPWTSAIKKLPVAGPVRISWTQIEGDGQANRKFHGGPDMAALAYCADHYPAWRDELGRGEAEFPLGAFGENLSVTGLTERDVCIGDSWSVGSTVVVQVSQPRQPCSNLVKLWGIRDLVERVHVSGRGGWYLRVLKEGVLTAGDEMKQVARPHPTWTVARAYEVMAERAERVGEAAELAGVAELSKSWREELAEVG